MFAAFALLAAFPLEQRLQAYQTPLDAKAVHDAFVLGQRNDQSTGDFLAPYIKPMTESRSDLHVAEIEILTPFAQVVDDSRKNTSGYTEAQAAQKYQQVGNSILVNVTLMLPSVFPQAANADGKNLAAPASATGNNDGLASAAGNSSSAPANNDASASSAAAPGGAGAASSGAGGGAAGGGGQGSAPAGTAATSAAGKAANEAQAKSDLRPENFWQSFQFYFKQNGKNIPSKALHDKPIYSTATKDKPAVLDGATVWMEFDARDVASQETSIEVVTPDGKTISATFDLKKLR